MKLVIKNKFLSLRGGSKVLDAIDADTEHFYVNVIPQSSQIRIAIPGYKWPEYYVAIVRNIGNM